MKFGFFFFLRLLWNRWDTLRSARETPLLSCCPRFSFDSPSRSDCERSRARVTRALNSRILFFFFCYLLQFLIFPLSSNATGYSDYCILKLLCISSFLLVLSLLHAIYIYIHTFIYISRRLHATFCSIERVRDRKSLID